MSRPTSPSYDFERFYQQSTPRLPTFADSGNIPGVGVARDIDPESQPLDSAEWETVYEGQGPVPIGADDAIGELVSQMPEGSLAPEEKDEFAGRARFQGLDCLAFYKSRRHRDRPPYVGRWGIFYLDRGVRYLSELASDSSPTLRTGVIPRGPSWGDGSTPGTTIEWACRFLRAHESYHFFFDVYAMGIEAARSTSLYEPLSQAFRRFPTHSVEESLANAAAFRWAKNLGRGGLAGFARDFMTLQPHAYSRFTEPDIELRAELAANLHDLDVRRVARRYDQAPFVSEVPRFLRQCPEFVVLTTKRIAQVRPALRIPTVRQVTDGTPVVKYLKDNSALRSKWQKTKQKLCLNPTTKGLNFKPWDQSKDEWSVRVDKGYRAHIRQTLAAGAVWEAIKIGTHKEMGHG